MLTQQHDLGLDRAHSKFLESALALFTSAEAQACGIQYLDREMKTVAQVRMEVEEIVPIRVYGNPLRPDFLNSSYAFTYKPYPSEEAVQAWTTAPQKSESFDIWVTHSPPKGRLDKINVPGLIDCEVLAKAIAQARPLLFVFGHYHYSWGIERVSWESDRDEVAKARNLTQVGMRNEFHFYERGSSWPITRGSETVFVNAAWMTMEKRAVPVRNDPFVVKLGLPSPHSEMEEHYKSH